MKAVDLRSRIESVYHQSGTNACTAHAVVNALDAMYDHAGFNLRFSRAWIWWWSRFNKGKAGLDEGASYSDLKFALEEKGVVLESQHPWDGSAANFPPKNPSLATGKIRFLRVAPDVNEIKRKLCLGVPTIIGMKLSYDFNRLSGQRDWRKSSYIVDGPVVNDHAMCIVGYDDDAGRFLVENSYGPLWGDGGFFGLPYEDFIKIHPECWSVDSIEGFKIKPVEGYVSIPYILNGKDYVDYYTNNKLKHRREMQALIDSQQWQKLIDYAVEHSLTDKMMENILLQPRRTLVELYGPTKEILDWSKFTWAEL